MSKKQELTRFRNLTKGRLIQHKNSLEQIMMNLPNDCQALSDKEKEMLCKLKEMYRDIIAPWDAISRLLNKKI